MAYSADSFVADEQPTTAKWNKLWSNDASFNDGSGIANFAFNTTAISNPYKFSAYRSAAQNTVGGSFSKISFDTEFFDTNSNFASGTYTAPVTGFYNFWWGSHVASTPDAVAALYKNGAILRWGIEQLPVGSAGSNGSAFVQATASDTFELYIYTTNTVAISVGASPLKTFFEGALSCRT